MKHDGRLYLDNEGVVIGDLNGNAAVHIDDGILELQTIDSGDGASMVFVRVLESRFKS